MSTPPATDPKGTPAPAAAAEIRLRLDRYKELAWELGWVTDKLAAAAIGCDPVTAWRVRSGRTKPGPRYVAGLLAAIAPRGFDDVFEVAPPTKDVD